MPAKKKTTALNKSEAVRQALAHHPDKAPAEIARLLTEQHGEPFRPKYVSSIKAKGRNHKPVTRQAAVPAAARQTVAPARPGALAAASVAELVTNLQAYIRRLGKDDLHRLIDTL